MSAVQAATVQVPALPDTQSDRRRDVDAKHQWVAQFLQERGCEGLLVLDPHNFAWLSSGAWVRSVLDPEDMPALLYTANQRYLVCSNVESQRMFDEEINGLGYMLKEWPWHWRRAQLVSDLCYGRAMLSDVPCGQTQCVGDVLAVRRRAMSAYEQACYQALGEILTQAVETTCREAQPGETERDLAARVAEKLIRRGAMPIALSVAGDGRSRHYRLHGYTSARIQQWAVVVATARKYGLVASAGRTFSFGPAQPQLAHEYLTACKIAAAYLAHTWPDSAVADIFQAVRRVYTLLGHEYEWELAPQGYVTGRAAVELTLVPDSQEVLRRDWVVVWRPSVGAAMCCETALLAESGPRLLTFSSTWPRVAIRLSGLEVLLPGILERTS